MAIRVAINLIDIYCELSYIYSHIWRLRYEAHIA